MIIQYIKDIGALFGKEHKFSKTQLFLFYNYLCLKNIVLTKIFHKHHGSTKVFGHKIFYGSLNSFFSMFAEIFLHETYMSKGNNKTIVDAGANIGLASLYFYLNNPGCIIHAFEPDKKTFRLLKKNIGHLPGINLYECGLDLEEGTTTFYDLNHFAGNTGNTVFKKHWHNNKSVNKYKITIKPLSSFDIQKIDYLKIDTEGTEYGILRDLQKNNLLKNVKCLNLEYHHFLRERHRLGEICNVLEEEGFLYTITSCPVSSSITTIESYQKLELFVLIINAKKT